MGYQTKIVGNRQEWLDFLNLPFEIYRNDPSWAPPLRSEVTKVLDTDRNPYFRGVWSEKFVCYHDHRPVARCIAVINPRHWARFGRKTAFFGFFESENDGQAALSLFSSVESFCREKQADYLEGPFNPNHYAELGLLVRNFDTPAFFETYNPPYYLPLLQSAGFEPVAALHTRIIRDTQILQTANSGKDVLGQASQQGFRMRPFRIWRMKEDLECIREIYNDAFENNWHFLPLSREEYRYSAKSMLLITNPSLVQIVEHMGKPVGAIQFVLNVNPILKYMHGRISFRSMLYFLWKRFTTREIVLYAVGIKKAYRNSPVIGLLLEALRSLGKRYRVVYCTWMMDSNRAAIKESARMGFVPYKWFNIYGKRLK